MAEMNGPEKKQSTDVVGRSPAVQRRRVQQQSRRKRVKPSREVLPLADDQQQIQEGVHSLYTLFVCNIWAQVVT